MTLEDYKARWLVQAWHEASEEAKADRFQYGPDTCAVTADAFRTLGLRVPEALDSGSSHGLHTEGPNAAQ